MTKKEKEKLLINALGLQIGDVVKIKYSKNVNTIETYEIKEYEDTYRLKYLHNDGEFSTSIMGLVYHDFEKITPKKKKGELYCGDFGTCTKCPFFALNCDGINCNFYEALEDMKEYMPCKAYEEYKKILDEEVEDE